MIIVQFKPKIENQSSVFLDLLLALNSVMFPLFETHCIFSISE